MLTAGQKYEMVMDFVKSMLDGPQPEPDDMFLRGRMDGLGLIRRYAEELDKHSAVGQ